MAPMQPTQPKVVGLPWQQRVRRGALMLCGIGLVAALLDDVDPSEVVLLVGAGLAMIYLAWAERLMLDQVGLVRRTWRNRWEVIPWFLVRDVTFHGSVPRRICLLYGQNPSRLWSRRLFWPIRPSLGRLGRRRQEQELAEIRAWWLAHRGSDWQAFVEDPPFAFPPDVNPFEPPRYE